MPKSKGLFYFAHPYTVKDIHGKRMPIAEEANFRMCNHRAANLIYLGFNVYSPISATHVIGYSLPGLVKSADVKMWYRLDNEIIDKTA